METLANATRHRGSAITGPFTFPEPTVAPDPNFADRITEILSPLVASGHLAQGEVSFLITRGTEAPSFDRLLDRPAKTDGLTPAQTRQTEFVSYIAGLALNGVLNQTELRTALFTPLEGQAESLATIENLLALKQMLNQVANSGMHGGSYWEPLTGGQGLVADCDRLMSKCPGMDATMALFLKRTKAE